MIALLYHLEEVGGPLVEPITTMSVWSGLAEAFSAEVICVDHTAQELGKTIARAHRFTRLEDAELLFLDHEWLYFLPQECINGRGRHVSLKELEHPREDAVYAFGPNFKTLDVEKNRRTERGRIVVIETPKPREFHAHVAATMALYDRYVRLGG